MQRLVGSVDIKSIGHQFPLDINCGSPPNRCTTDNIGFVDSQKLDDSNNDEKSTDNFTKISSDGGQSDSQFFIKS